MKDDGLRKSERRSASGEKAKIELPQLDRGKVEEMVRATCEAFGGRMLSADQTDRLFERIKWLTYQELRTALDHLIDNEHRAPQLHNFLEYTRSAQLASRYRRKAALLANSESCGYCFDVGIMVCYDQENDNKEISIRCGQCQIADIFNIAQDQPAWTEGSNLARRFFPKASDYSLNGSMSDTGRLDRLLAMSEIERQAEIRKEPWLSLALFVYEGKGEKRAAQRDSDPF